MNTVNLGNTIVKLRKKNNLTQMQLFGSSGKA